MRRTYLVSGKVQGVGFRQFTAEKARALKVRGWVHNLPDGSVEAMAEADEATLQALEAILKKGPPFGRVDNLKIIDGKSGGELPLPFEIRR